MRHLKRISEDKDTWSSIYNKIFVTLNNIRDILIDFEDQEEIKYSIDGSFRILASKGDTKIFLDVALISLKATLSAGGKLDSVNIITNISLPGKTLNSESQEKLEDILIGIKRMNRFSTTKIDFEKEYTSMTCILITTVKLKITD